MTDKKDDLSGVDPRIIEAAQMAVPLALDWAGKKLVEAFDNFKARFEDETGTEFDAVEPDARAVELNQQVIDTLADKPGFSAELRERLVNGGARIDTIMESDDDMGWPERGVSHMLVQEARLNAGALPLNLSNAPKQIGDPLSLQPGKLTSLEGVPRQVDASGAKFTTPEWPSAEDAKATFGKPLPEMTDLDLGLALGSASASGVSVPGKETKAQGKPLPDAAEPRKPSRKGADEPESRDQGPTLPGPGKR